MRLWSVELESNSWNDDLFNGTFDECLKYCEENGYKLDGIEGRLAEIEIDGIGSVINTYNFYVEEG